MPQPDVDHYIGMNAQRVTLGDREFSLRVHWAIVDGRATCVGVDLRSFTSKQEAKLHLGEDARPLPGGWQEITSPALRQLRLGEAVEESRQVQHALTRYFRQREREARTASREERSLSDHRPRRGPRPLFSDAELREIVPPAYGIGGRTPVESVRQALERRRGERVTKEQARKAVQRARAIGALGPYERKSS